MARSTQNHQSVSLFPFLAVLVCAMGALIFLLLVTTRQIRSEALAAQRGPVEQVTGSTTAIEPEMENPESTPEPLARNDTDAEVNEESTMVEAREAANVPVEVIDEAAEWRKRREDLERDLDEKTARAAAFEKEIMLRDQQKTLRLEETEQIDSQISLVGRELQRRESSRNVVREANHRLQLQIESVSAAIVEARTQKTPAASEFAFVPYDGSSGTVRRPVLIECTDRGFRFVPEGIELTEEQFNGFVPDYNPLLAGATALIDHWSHKSGEQVPYVLLIVRPAGTMSYYAARRMLKRLNSDFGYELVAKDLELAEDHPDPAAQNACRNAIDEVLKQKKLVLAAVSRGGTAPSGRAGGAGDSRSGRSIKFNRDGRIEIVDRAESRSDSPPASRPNPAAVSPNVYRGTSADRQTVSAPTPENVKGTLRDLQQSPRGSQATNGGPDQGTMFRNDDRTKPGQSQIGNDGVRKNSADKTLLKGFADRSAGSGRFSSRRTDEEHSGEVRSDVKSYSGSFSRADREQAGRLNPKSTGDPISGGTDRRLRHADRGQSGISGRPEAGPPGTMSRQGSPSTRSLQSRTLTGNSKREQRRRWGHSPISGTIGFEREVNVIVEPGKIQVGKYFVRISDAMTGAELGNAVADLVDLQARTWGPPPERFYWVPRLRALVEPEAQTLSTKLAAAMKRFGLSMESVSPASPSGSNRQGGPRS